MRIEKDDIIIVGFCASFVLFLAIALWPLV